MTFSPNEAVLPSKKDRTASSLATRNDQQPIKKAIQDINPPLQSITALLAQITALLQDFQVNMRNFAQKNAQSFINLDINQIFKAFGTKSTGIKGQNKAEVSIYTWDAWGATSVLAVVLACACFNKFQEALNLTQPGYTLISSLTKMSYQPQVAENQIITQEGDTQQISGRVFTEMFQQMRTLSQQMSEAILQAFHTFANVVREINKVFAA